MTYYCLNVEFYDNFDEEDIYLFTEVKACVTSRQAKVKPKNQFKQTYGLTAFKLWLSTEQRANELCEMVKSGDVYIDDLIAFYEVCLPLEGRAA